MYKTYKELLFDLKDAEIQIKKLNDKIQLIRNRLEGITGMDYDKIQTSKTNAKIDNDLLYDDLINIQNEIDMYTAYKHDISLRIQETDNFLKEFDEKDRKIFNYRFVNELKIWQIANITGYSERQVSRIIRGLKGKMA